MNQAEFRASATRTSLLGMGGNVLLTVFKLIAGLAAHSGAMVSDAVHSASDLVGGAIVIIGVRISSRAPDQGHPYGHERYESIAAAVIAVILAVVGGTIGLGAVRSIAGGAGALETPGALALAAALVSIAVKEAMFQYTHRVAQRLKSSALAAEAWHHRSDALSSVGALIGIAGARLGVPVMEPIASLVISLFILKAAFDILRDAVNQVVDHAGDPALEKALRDTALRQEGVVGVDMLHTRMFASKVYVDLEISADGSMTLREAHEIAERVHDEIERAFPEVKHIMVHVNPA